MSVPVTICGVNSGIIRHVGRIAQVPEIHNNTAVIRIVICKILQPGHKITGCRIHAQIIHPIKVTQYEHPDIAIADISPHLIKHLRNRGGVMEVFAAT